GAADDHVGGTGQHRGRHPAQRDATQRDVVDPRCLRLHAAGRHSAAGRRRTAADGAVHADRRAELQLPTATVGITVTPTASLTANPTTIGAGGTVTASVANG